MRQKSLHQAQVWRKAFTLEYVIDLYDIFEDRSKHSLFFCQMPVADLKKYR